VRRGQGDQEPAEDPGRGARDRRGLVGEGDLSQDLGFPRQYEHPTVAAAIGEVVAICKEKGVVCGHPHVDSKNVERVLEQGFRWLMASPERAFNALNTGLKLSGRA